MLRRNVHSTDEELIRDADGELPGRKATEVHKHLKACWQCRARKAAIESGITNFTRAYREAQAVSLPPIDGPRSLLRAHLAQQVAANSKTGRNQPFLHFFAGTPSLISVCLLLLMITLLGQRLIPARSSQVDPSKTSSLDQYAVPNPSLTPGATRMVAVSDVCSMAHEQVVGQVTSSLRQEVFREYGIVNARPNDYEIDYLIAPGLGGTEEIQNLWPEPYSSSSWNAFAKDSLEEHLHQLVCSGALDLPTAQKEIATNWIAAYKKYFHTDKPLPSSQNEVALVKRDSI